MELDAVENRDWDQRSPRLFTYNANPKLIPRFSLRSTGKPEEVHRDDSELPRSEKLVSRSVPNVTSTNRSSNRHEFPQLLQQFWLLLFFRLPALYHTRMLQIGVNSDIGAADLHLMSTTLTALWKHHDELPPLPAKSTSDAVPISPHLMHFRVSWEMLVDDMLQEWKMFNIISTLIETSVPLLLSLDSQTGSDPIVKFCALLSFICAGISLLCGSFCVLQFGSMRKMPKAAEWTREAHKSDQLMWWNCWIMLAMPATWLTWSILLLLASMMSYTWRSFSQHPLSSVSAHTILSFQITISAVLGCGVFCVVALVSTLCLQFGDPLEQKFVYRALDDRRPSPKENTVTSEWEQPKGSPQHAAKSPSLSGLPRSHEPLPTAPISSVHAPFSTTKLMDADTIYPVPSDLPRYVHHRAQNFSPWSSFTIELQKAFQNSASPSPEDDAFSCIERWNEQVFTPNGLEAILCMEFPIGSEQQDQGIYSVYIMDVAHANIGEKQRLEDEFGPLPASLHKICLIKAMAPSVSRKRGYPLGIMLEREQRITTQTSEPGTRPHRRSSVPPEGSSSQAYQSASAQTTDRSGSLKTQSTHHTRARRTDSAERTRRR
ncbi:hypothetical protein C8R42DRAFT_651867 [Lentinula raphanica]|nr:hypothetical protein C8R42DRAFT_651867 [Lentinula raphanica]